MGLGAIVKDITDENLTDLKTLIHQCILLNPVCNGNKFPPEVIVVGENWFLYSTVIEAVQDSQEGYFIQPKVRLIEESLQIFGITDIIDILDYPVFSRFKEPFLIDNKRIGLIPFTERRDQEARLKKRSGDMAMGYYDFFHNGYNIIVFPRDSLRCNYH